QEYNAIEMQVDVLESKQLEPEVNMDSNIDALNDSPLSGWGDTDSGLFDLKVSNSYQHDCDMPDTLNLCDNSDNSIVQKCCHSMFDYDALDDTSSIISTFNYADHYNGTLLHCDFPSAPEHFYTQNFDSFLENDHH
ncbi:hypothetical protein RFI_13450, partial [Reticulomyxa filosa]